MSKIIVNILAAFIPNKEKRKEFRRKQNSKAVLFDKLHDKIISKQREKGFSFYDLLKKITESPCYLVVDSNHNFLNMLLQCQPWKYQSNGFNNDGVMLCWEIRPTEHNFNTLKLAYEKHKELYFIGDSFLRSINTFADRKAQPKYQKGISFTIDDLTCYFDATRPSRIENMLNDKELRFTLEQINRAKKCIEFIVNNYLTKYNSQPIFTPKIGRDGVKKVLVVDQAYNDMSIIKGGGSYQVFEQMLQSAIQENPDADIIIKTHPDTIAGKAGYYTGIVQKENIYRQTDPINPISLIQYVDKVYVCTTQFGFEALMCGKEVHTFGMPFYAGWGLTKDRQKCTRRTNTRTLEEVFYIAYIIYSHYVNPDTGKQCEIEEAMEYLLKLREEYFKEFNIRKDV